MQSAHLIIASGVLLSLKLGYLAAVAIYHLFAGVTSIGSFSSGFLTFTNITDKGRDLYAGITFSVASVCAFILVNEFMKWIERRTSEDVAISASRLIILANIPAAFAIADGIRGRLPGSIVKKRTRRIACYDVPRLPRDTRYRPVLPSTLNWWFAHTGWAHRHWQPATLARVLSVAKNRGRYPSLYVSPAR